MLPHMLREILISEFKRRKRTNGSYSIRAFAESLELPSGRLSEFMSGKRQISKKMSDKLSARLGVTGLMPASPSTPPSQFNLKDDYYFINDQTFEVIADPNCFAILSLMDIKGFKSDVKWVASRLNISPFDAKKCIESLLQVGLLQTDKKNQWVKTKKSIQTSTDLESLALKISHRETLKQASRCIDEISVDLRDITSITLTMDMEKLTLVKKLIKNFRRSVAKLVENAHSSEVYNLNIQLVPVTNLKGDT
ncbi:MAG: TIGR02147 family protein [Bdellovibrionales bacterium]